MRLIACSYLTAFICGIVLYLKSSAVTILKISFEGATLASIKIKIKWTILHNLMIDFYVSTEIKDNRE